MAEDTVKRGRGRPRTASGPRVNVYLGSDQAARELRKDLETMQTSLGHSCLSDCIRVLVEQWKSGNMVSDASTQVVPTADASTQCSFIGDNQREQQRVHVVTVGSQCLPMQSYTPQLRDQIQMFSMPFVSVTNSPYMPLLPGQRQFQVMTDGGGQYIPVPVPVQQEERLQKDNITTKQREAAQQPCLNAQEEQKQQLNSPNLVVEKLPPPKRRVERASITDTTKKALLKCIETRKSSHSSPRNRGRRGRKRGRKTT